MESCRFIGPEGGTRLFDSARSRNTLAAVPCEHGFFVAGKLLQENAFKIRGLASDGRQRSVYVARAERVPCIAYELDILTDLKVTSAVVYEDMDWQAELEVKEVLVATSDVVQRLLEDGLLNMRFINVLILESCHRIYTDTHLQAIMSFHCEQATPDQPRVLALTYPIFLPKNKLDPLTDIEQNDRDNIKDIAVTSCESIENSDRKILVKSAKIVRIDDVTNVENVDDPKENKLEISEEQTPINNFDEDSSNLQQSKKIENLGDLKEISNSEIVCEINTKELKDNIDDEISKESIKENNVDINSAKHFEDLNTDVNLDKSSYNAEAKDENEAAEDYTFYEKLEWKLEDLEKKLCCKADLAEDIDSMKRPSAIVTDPRELIVQYSARPPDEELPSTYVELEDYMRQTVRDILEFINQHRYDPTEIYGDEAFTEELKGIPDPTLDPKQVFQHFLYTLDELGPYGADKASFCLLGKLEKLKVRTPYERHFLLLCLCTTVFLKIRFVAESVFQNYETDWDKLKNFSSKKVLRFIEILQHFKPPNDVRTKISEMNRNKSNINHNKTDNSRSDKNKHLEGNVTSTERTLSMLEEIDNCDFKSLSNVIVDKINTYSANLPEIHEIVPETKHNSILLNSESTDINVSLTRIGSIDGISKSNQEISSKDNPPENGNSDIVSPKDTKDDTKSHSHKVLKAPLMIPKRQGSRGKGRGRQPRHGYISRALQMQQNPDALCGIVFMNEPIMARVLFMLVVELSRSHPDLSFLCAQYTGDENASEPSAEPRELDKKRRKQEEVLKKFRMHECNLLLATSAVEEGIDLPRCNLVLRWDPPANYRSHSVCRSRARAPRSACALLANDPSGLLVHRTAVYKELDQIIRRKCGCGMQDEPPLSEEENANIYNDIVKPYTPTINGEHHKQDNNKPDKIDRSDKIENTFVNRDSYIHHKESVTKYVEPARKSDKSVAKVVESVRKSESKETLDNIIEIKCNQFAAKINVSVQNDSNAFPSDIIDVSANSQFNIVKSETCEGISEDFLKESDKIIDDVLVTENEMASVDLSNAISLVNRYCGKLPSDTFTRLAPQWWIEEVYIPTSQSTNLPTRKGSCDERQICCPTDQDNASESGEKDGYRKAYICTLRLPLNCPVKYNIVGHPMPTRVLARRMVALQACRILHRSAELDNQLMPIGKENFRVKDTEYAPAPPGDTDAEQTDPARPGTTKRRQYYYKRTAWSFTDCEPVQNATDAEIESKPTLDTNDHSESYSNSQTGDRAGKRNMLYAIISQLCCALPERYNTRGRKLHAPQTARQGLGILTSKKVNKIPAFPVYTRSGEVRVVVRLVPEADARVSPRRARLVRRFLGFMFADVLRVRRRGMRLCSGGARNNYYVVPTRRALKEDGTEKIDIDWDFLELIYDHTEKKNYEMEKISLWNSNEEQDLGDGKNMELKATSNDTNSKNDSTIPVVNGDKKQTNSSLDRVTEKENEDKKEEEGKKRLKNPFLGEGETFEFDAEKYKEAVVTPWYRNQDQPQFFLVAEICWKLTPESAFPSDTHTTFRHYYTRKYGVQLTQSEQPLLDVDHTSARLNLLTPRYVNRKGVALPVSSERTRRAKRDRLDQKQILVPELCRVHPFAAPLWFATVSLPCVLYRINALLIADEIRRAVAMEVGLGTPDLPDHFEWPPLDFGWSLAEVLSVDEAKAEQEKKEKARQEINLENEMEDSVEETPQIDKTVNDILMEKENAESAFEIGTWSNDMASSLPDDYDELLDPLPPNLTFCTSASGGINWQDSFERPQRARPAATRAFSMADSDCSYMSSDLDSDDSSLETDASDDETLGLCRGCNANARLGVRIEYRTPHEAEALELPPDGTEDKKRGPPQPSNVADILEAETTLAAGEPPLEHIQKFHQSVEEHKRNILENGLLIKENEPIKFILPPTVKCLQSKLPNHKHSLGSSSRSNDPISDTSNDQISDASNDPISDVIETLESLELKDKSDLFKELFPFGTIDEDEFLKNGNISIESIEKSKRILLARLKKTMTDEEIKKKNYFSMVDVDIDSPDYVDEKVANVGFDDMERYMKKLKNPPKTEEKVPKDESCKDENKKEFDFDYQPNLEGHPGPSPSVILQALTMSNANDGINLERLETIGDSFLKFAITAYLYCARPAVHEGKLSHMRSKQVSNLNLYRLGRSKRLGARMIASKFEPHDNWLPPCHRAPSTAARNEGHEATYWREGTRVTRMDAANATRGERDGCFIPYNLITQHSIPDKSVADCVEALIGAYLIECGPRGALLFMSWLGIKVLPRYEVPINDEAEIEALEKRIKENSTEEPSPPARAHADGSDAEPENDSDSDEEWPSGTERGSAILAPYKKGDKWVQPVFGELRAPPSPLLHYISNPDQELAQMLSGYEELERTLGYRFRDRSLLLQALTHASHHLNRLTDCYQRLEFLGDAILDYLITRHLYEDARRHSPGALTDLRSALVNNTIFATLAVRHGFHKYFRHASPALQEVLTRYVNIQHENGHSISEEHYLIQEDEMEQAEDVEVPKALGDLFESVAGAIFLDSGMSLGAVWRSYAGLMGAELEAFSAAAPKSPVRELLEAEPDTAKFGKPERLADGRRVRVCVEVFGRGTFKGIGRNYRIAKGTAARCALRHLKKSYRNN